MTLLARYVLKAFAKPFAAAVGALVLLVMMADLMERLDKFLAAKTPPRLVIEYLLALVPLRLVEILPVAGLLAVLFALGTLSHHKELLAAMAGGVHPWRCVRPILVTGLFTSLLCGVLGEFVNPPAGRRVKEIWNGDIRGLTQQRRTRFDAITATGKGGTIYSIGVLDIEEGWLRDVLLDIPRQGHPYLQIQARKAEWVDDRWTFHDGMERRFGEDGTTLEGFSSFKTRRLQLKDSPLDLVPKEGDTALLGSKALKRHIQSLKALGVPTRRLEVEWHMKLALPWANLIVLILGIPLAFEKAGGKVKAVASALGVAFLYFGLMQVGRALGQKTWCAPWAGAWMANAVFLIIGGRLFLKMRKLS